MRIRSVQIAATMVAALFLTGCESTRLYSEKRDKQGAEASAAWKSINLNAYIVAERSNLNALLKAELEAQAAATTLTRDLRLESAVLSNDSFNTTTLTPLKEKIKVLGADQNYLDYVNSLEPLRRQVQKFREFGEADFSRVGKSPPPTCQEVLRPKEMAPSDFASLPSGSAPETLEERKIRAGVGWTPTFILEYQKCSRQSNTGHLCQLNSGQGLELAV